MRPGEEGRCFFQELPIHPQLSILRAQPLQLGALGFADGNVLEPGSGNGAFIGAAPPTAHVTGVELDDTTARISRLLYPDATVRSESFADTRIPAGTFDATIGNVPFADLVLHVGQSL